jgi:hypothetical protein
MILRVAVVLEIEHQGELTADEIAGTLGVWVEQLPVEVRAINTQTDDGATATFDVVRAISSIPFVG